MNALRDHLTDVSRITTIITATVALGASAAETHADDAGALFVPAPAQAMADYAGGDPTVVRSGHVVANLALLDTMGSADSAALELFDGVTMDMVCDSVRRVPGGCTVLGSVAGDPDSDLLLTVRAGGVAGIIRRGDGTMYRVRSMDDGSTLVMEINGDGFPGCAGGDDAPLEAGVEIGAGTGAAVAADGCDDGSTVDVLIAYTPAARAAAGGTAAIELEADLAIDAANNAYQNSGITTRLRLVHIAETSYTESIATYGDHLTRITNGSDGYMDELHTLRDSHGADLVALMVDDGAFCGLAWLMTSPSTSFESYGFSVTTWFCAAGNLSFAHELGHNMGCCHDHDNCGGGAYSYSWGHRFYGGGGPQYRTVMAYSPGARIPYFSNPSVSFDGTPTGIASGPNAADNTRTINTTDSIVANFRCALDVATTYVGPSGGRWLDPANWSGGTVPDGTTDITLATPVVVDGAGAVSASLTLASGGELVVNGGGDLTTAPIVVASGGSITVTSGTVTAGTVTVRGGATVTVSTAAAEIDATTLDLDPGALVVGAGTIDADVLNRGEVRPGTGIGTLTIDGSYAQTSGGQLTIQCPESGPADVLDVSGAVTLSGTLQVVLADPNPPAISSCFDVVTTVSVTGWFTTEDVPFLAWDRMMNADPQPGAARLCVDPVDPASVFGISVGEKFGESLANAGDVNADGTDDFIVGAPYNDEGGTNAGRATVHSGATGAELYAMRGGQAGNRFGWAVAGVGDADSDGYDDFAVGVPFYGDSRGRVRVYSGQTGDVLFTKKGKAKGDKFGFAVDGGIDIDNDGRDDVIVAAPYNDDAGTKAGRVSVYSGRNGSAIGHLLGRRKQDLFGWSVAAIGRANSDGFGDFAVGAPKNDDGGSNAGRVAVFSGRNFQELYHLEGNRTGDQFGRSLAAAGRVDADARDDFVVGSPYFDGSAGDRTGRVEVFSGRDGDRLWSRNGQAPGERLGWSVAGAGDVNGDGRADIAVAAPFSDSGADSAGRVDVRSGADASLLAAISGDFAGDRLGTSLASLGDTDADGCADLLLAAPREDTAGVNAGRVYVFLSTCGAPDVWERMTVGGARVDDVARGPMYGTVFHSTGDDEPDDVLEVLGRWGACPAGRRCAGDHNGDGYVDAADLMLALAGGVDDGAAEESATGVVVVRNDDVIDLAAEGGVVVIDGSYVQTAAASLIVTANGARPVDEHDLLVVAGTAQLGGTLELRFGDDFTPAPGDAFTVIVADSVTGTFDRVLAPDGVDVTVRTAASGVVQLVIGAEADLGPPDEIDVDFVLWLLDAGPIDGVDLSMVLSR